MADGRKHISVTLIPIPKYWWIYTRTVNQARAVRVAELINDYRTLLLHISQQQVEVSPQDLHEEGFVVLRECHNAAQRLASANYQPCPVNGQGNAETEKAELQR